MQSNTNMLISIHALREEGDYITQVTNADWTCISIHALREEGDTFLFAAWRTFSDFYPRPP